MEEKSFKEKIEKLENFSFPRYKDLPEIELYMDQVISVAEKYLGVLSVGKRNIITSSMINNYVKNGVIPPPEKKRYTRDHLAQIIIVCALKQTVEITDISVMIKKMTEAYGVAETFDTFAALYEKYTSAIVISARETSDSDSASGGIYKTVVDNAILSSTARTVVEYAMSTIEPPAEEEKPKKKKSKEEEPAEN